MSNLVRYLDSFVRNDLKKKMVFLAGPRQVGKTTFAINFLKPESVKNEAYLNWDLAEARQIILNGRFPADKRLIVLDEIHKYSGWKNLLKGFYDTKKEDHQFLITGSAKLNHYSRSGDSLLGRYHFYRLHPLSVTELKIKTKNELLDLLNLGGFPEVYFSQDMRFAKRWRKERQRLIIKEDLRDLENIRDISRIEFLFEEIKKTVSSQLNYNSFSSVVEVDIKTIQKWVDIFDNLYLSFRINPYFIKNLKTLKRAEKLYFWDWGMNLNDGARFENMVASHLFKYCNFIEDTEGEDMELKYLRDVEGREIDFVVLKNNKPLFGVECKSGEKNISKHIYYFKERSQIPYFYQVHLGDLHFKQDKNIEVLPFIKFCEMLQLP